MKIQRTYRERVQIMNLKIRCAAALAAVMLCGSFLVGRGFAEEPQAETFVVTFAGDCTFATDEPLRGQAFTFEDVVGDDYQYPFANVIQYFANDDFTIVNLEGVMMDEGFSDKDGFRFRGPTAYVNILTENSVEAVTIANNHTMDYGRPGYESTKATLDAAGMTYVEGDDYAMYRTDRGFTVGLYGANLLLGMWDLAQSVDLEKMEMDIRYMRSQGADVIIMPVHWGVESSYTPLALQTERAHQFIDLGVDIIFGTHPHVLQKIEEYNGGIIYYSLGNFSFGGHRSPRDQDTAVLQQEVIREPDGSTHLGELTIIPCKISSSETDISNFQPTPYKEGTEEYERVLSKLSGTYQEW